jgi:hypothetical protein
VDYKIGKDHRKNERKIKGAKTNGKGNKTGTSAKQ